MIILAGTIRVGQGKQSEALESIAPEDIVPTDFGPPQRTHGVDDPTSPADAPPRRSIEVRALVFWS